MTLEIPKGTNRLFRKSNIISDVDLTNLPFWENDRIPIMGIWLCKIAQWIYFAASVQTDSVKVESVVRCGQRCSFLQWLWHHDTILLHIWIIIGGRYFTVYRSPVRWWFPVRNWKYYRFWTNLSISKRSGFNLYWPQVVERFLISQNVSLESCNIKVWIRHYVGLNLLVGGKTPHTFL